jgi:hypothetical protein
MLGDPVYARSREAELGKLLTCRGEDSALRLS